MLIKLFSASLMLTLISCNSSKETIQDANDNSMNKEQSDSKIMDAQMVSDGFHLGQVKHLKNSKCEYIIIDTTTKAQFDPINISEETYQAFREDTQKIYYKYRGLRMMNRCTEAQPIQITEIKKREG